MKPEEVGNYLKKLRLEHQLTQKELASKLHITHQAVSNWEKGKALPDITILSQLGDVYGVSIDNLLLKVSPEDVKQNKKSLILKRVFSGVGLFVSLICVSLFVFYNRSFYIAIIVSSIVLMPSLIYSFLMKERKWYIEYLVITTLIITITVIVIPRHMNFYLMNETKFFQLNDEVEILYPREFDELTHAKTYEYIFDRYALIYTEGEEDIDIFNLSKYFEGEYQTIETPGMNIYDLEIFGEDIFITTYNEEIPGEFKLYRLDFITFDFELYYESQDVLRMYKAFEQLYLISDPVLESQTKVYQYNFTNETMESPILLDYRIYDMAEYFVDYESYIMLSVANLEQNEPNNTIGLFDYNFDLQHIVYEEDPGIVHHLFSGYGITMLGTDQGAIVFDGLTYEIIGEEYARWPQPLSQEFIRIGESIYYKDFYTKEITLYSTKPFYDEDYYPQAAKFMIDDDSGNFYMLDNQMIGFAIQKPHEINQVYMSSGFRVVCLIYGILTYGFFITLGHKRKPKNKVQT